MPDFVAPQLVSDGAVVIVVFPPRTIIPEAACVALSPQRRGAYSELSTTEKEWGPTPGSEHPRGVCVATDDPRLKGK
jgi:hypothetical protein